MKGEKATCPECGGQFIKKSRVNRFCCYSCNISYFAKRNIQQITKFKVFERDNFTCIYCGKSSIEDSTELQLEHVVPCLGDRRFIDFGNVVTSCLECNQSKGKRHLSEDVVQRIKKVINDRNILKGLPMGI